MLRSGSDVRVRAGTVADAAALDKVFRDSWSLAYQGVIPGPQLDAFIRKRNVAWWRDAMLTDRGQLVIEVAGTVGGYTTFGRRRGPGRFQGEIYELYLGPSYQGLGLGELLFEGARHRLDLASLDGLIVWALAGNEQACDFYLRRGGRMIARSIDRSTGVPLRKVAFGWP